MILSDERRIDLAKSVNSALRHGWELQGGIAVSNWTNEGNCYFYQAMVREKPDSEEEQ